jgi:hypothetical protein
MVADILKLNNIPCIKIRTHWGVTPYPSNGAKVERCVFQCFVNDAGI